MSINLTLTSQEEDVVAQDGGVHHKPGVSWHTDGDRSRADVGWNPRVQTEGDFAESLPKRRSLARIESA
jgi:hypothetical protein